MRLAGVVLERSGEGGVPRLTGADERGERRTVTRCRFHSNLLVEELQRAAVRWTYRLIYTLFCTAQPAEWIKEKAPPWWGWSRRELDRVRDQLGAQPTEAGTPSALATALHSVSSSSPLRRWPGLAESNRCPPPEAKP